MRSSYTIFAFMLSQLFFANNIFANTNHCPPNAVHCAYITGLSDDLHDGRFVKLTHKNIQLVVCFNSYGMAIQTQRTAPKFLGKNTDHYAICTDLTGTKCKEVGIDNFVISETDQGYIAEPPLFEISLGADANQFPTCDALSKNNTVYRQ